MILLVTPAVEASGQGNGVTASRWAGILRDLGHAVRIAREYVAGEYTALVALHARKSADAIRAFSDRHPQAPVVIALTGTDLYPDLATAGVDPSVLAIGTRLVVLQGLGVRQLEPALRERTRVIVQSVPAMERPPAAADRFEVAVLAHLRPVKDPLRAAAAVRRLPPSSQIHVTHVGQGLDGTLARRAADETAANPRYDWVGPLPREQALTVLAGSRLLLLTSRHEGGANVVSEALAAGVPVLSSAIPGSIGLLGDGYPGYYPVGDTTGLAAALLAIEQDREGRLRALHQHCAALRPLVDPARERQAWAALLGELNLPARTEHTCPS